LVVQVFLLLLDSLFLLLSQKFDVDWCLFNQISFNLIEELTLGSYVTFLMAAVALYEQWRVIIRVFVQIISNLLVNVHGVRVLLMNSLNELTLVQVHKLRETS
jgi:hypothetical protein